MQRKILSTILFIICTLGTFNVQSQITRGAVEDEIYISTDWYIDDNGDIHYAIYYSSDNGETIKLKYQNQETPPNGEMKIGLVLGDADTGTLYNYGNSELWVSFDYGVDWEIIENHPYAKYITGNSNGEIYRRNDYNLYRSENYGETFILIIESLSEPVSDIGNIVGELYGITGTAGEGYNLFFSYNFGANFTDIPIDSSIAFWVPGGHYPQISRGTQSGELYLVSWWLNSAYKIFHSIDTGYTWTEQFESEYIDMFFWRVHYTAGREPGSFYVMRSRVSELGDHIWLYIDYSSDYGQTFTTWFHDLDSLYTSVQPIKKTALQLAAYPNPFFDKTTITCTVPENCNNAVLSIYNIHGNLIRKFSLKSNVKQFWDGRNENGNRIPKGIYFYNVKYNSFQSQTNKLIFH